MMRVALALLCALAMSSPPQAQTTPLSIVLLVDVTASVSEAMASFIWDGRGSVQDMRPSGTKPPHAPRDLFRRPIERGLLAHLDRDDRVQIGIVADTVSLAGSFSSDRLALRQTLRDALDVDDSRRYGRTPLWDAVDAAVTALEGETGRRVVLLITDGLSTGNRQGLAAVIEHARAAHVEVSSVLEAWQIRSGRGFALRDSPDGPWFLMTSATGHPIGTHLRRLADETGGFVADDGVAGWPDLEHVLPELLDRIRGGARGR